MIDIYDKELGERIHALMQKQWEAYAKRHKLGPKQQKDHLFAFRAGGQAVIDALIYASVKEAAAGNGK